MGEVRGIMFFEVPKRSSRDQTLDRTVVQFSTLFCVSSQGQNWQESAEQMLDLNSMLLEESTF